MCVWCFMLLTPSFWCTIRNSEEVLSMTNEESPSKLYGLPSLEIFDTLFFIIHNTKLFHNTLPKSRVPVEYIIILRPKWIALKSLFFFLKNNWRILHYLWRSLGTPWGVLQSCLGKAALGGKGDFFFFNNWSQFLLERSPIGYCGFTLHPNSSSANS